MEGDVHINDRCSAAIRTGVHKLIEAGEIDKETGAIGALYAAFNLALDAGMSDKGAFIWMRDNIANMKRQRRTRA